MQDKFYIIVLLFSGFLSWSQDCPSITSPMDGAEDVSPDTAISWNAVDGALGYFLLVGTTPGGRDLVDRVDVGNTTTYEPPGGLPGNTVIYVKVTVRFSDGPDNTCPVDEFTTGPRQQPSDPRQDPSDCPPLVNPVANVLECEFYVLPQLDTSQGYFTEAGGGGTELRQDDRITESMTLYIYAENEDCTDEISFTIIIDPESCAEPDIPENFDFPEFFTPNGDGVNDFWPMNENQGNLIELVYIFDRYGTLLSQIIGNSQGWDGNFNGRPLPSSTYWYRGVSSSGEEVRGHFLLKR